MGEKVGDDSLDSHSDNDTEQQERLELRARIRKEAWQEFGKMSPADLYAMQTLIRERKQELVKRVEELQGEPEVRLGIIARRRQRGMIVQRELSVLSIKLTYLDVREDVLQQITARRAEGLVGPPSSKRSEDLIQRVSADDQVLVALYRVIKDKKKGGTTEIWDEVAAYLIDKGLPQGSGGTLRRKWVPILRERHKPQRTMILAILKDCARKEMERILAEYG